VDVGPASQSGAPDGNGTSEDRASRTRSVTADKRPPIEDFRDLGRDMFLTGLVSSHTGSLSVRRDDKMWVSRRGAMLGRLTENDLVEVAIGGDVPEDAAEESIVH